jgi:hypothetical protein
MRIKKPVAATSFGEKIKRLSPWFLLSILASDRMQSIGEIRSPTFEQKLWVFKILDSIILPC